MKLRRLTALALCLALLGMSAALADTYYVRSEGGAGLSLRDEATNEVLATLPDGTALSPDPNKSTDVCAYVTYGGQSGLVLWRYLTRTAPDGAPAPAPADSWSAPAPAAAPDRVPGTFELRAVGAAIQRANDRNKAAGDVYTSMTVTPEDSVVVTAVIPKGHRIDYWVINGVRYDFLKTIKYLRLTNIDADYTFEVVYTKSASETLHAAVPEADGRRVLQVIHGEFCHLKSETKGAGGWITMQDFTDDYRNRATGLQEQGGQVTAKVRAVIPRGKRVAGWKFNEMEVYPAIAFTQFIVRRLDASMTYEPIFGDKFEAPPTVTTPWRNQYVPPTVIYPQDPLPAPAGRNIDPTTGLPYGTAP